VKNYIDKNIEVVISLGMIFALIGAIAFGYWLGGEA